MGADQKDKFRSAAGDALVIRGGGKVEKPAAGALELRGYSLKEIARESLRVANQSFHGDAMEMVGRALTNSDLPIILGNTANKSLFDGYEGSEETWTQWCDTGSVNDFKTHTSARMSETEDLDEISEDDEYKYGKASDAKEEYKVVTYGKLFKISRQAIINDDLGAITRIPRSHGPGKEDRRHCLCGAHRQQRNGRRHSTFPCKPREPRHGWGLERHDPRRGRKAHGSSERPCREEKAQHQAAVLPGPAYH